MIVYFIVTINNKNVVCLRNWGERIFFNFYFRKKPKKLKSGLIFLKIVIVLQEVTVVVVVVRSRS